MLKLVYIIVLLCIINISMVCMQSNDQREERLVTYHRCLLDLHCQNINENSFCFDNDNNRVGRCKCIDGYELLSRNRTFFACLQNAGWEEPCEKNIQCYSTLSTDAVCDGV
ncbi:uncharacterized protein LOC108915874, partial [Anoplophora glabripennis]|uniref:uncharacterized protein LOC108915874 n=1 Tax=Anoplophora glabripennis TaxID=217634 RepID=UPI000873AD89